MDIEQITERFFETLITGDRGASRDLIENTLEAGAAPEEVAHDIYWPTLESVNDLFRKDQLSKLGHHYATRLLRSIVDQTQGLYTQRARRGKKILMFSGPAEQDELAAQLLADLAEADGYEVFYGGGGIANDEILAETGRQRPDILLMFASAPTDAPNIRQLIDSIHGVDAVPGLQIVVGGGVFNRAEGLAQEIGADIWAKSPQEMLKNLVTYEGRRAPAEQRTVGRSRNTSRKAA